MAKKYRDLEETEIRQPGVLFAVVDSIEAHDLKLYQIAISFR